MKTATRIIALLMALVMCLGLLGTTAFAAGEDQTPTTGILTIKAPTGMSMDNRTFTLYRIFDGVAGEEMVTDSNNVSRRAITYQWPTPDAAGAAKSPFWNFFFDKTDSNGLQLDLAETSNDLAVAVAAINTMTANSAQTAELGTKLRAYITAHDISPVTATPAATAASVTYSSLPSGYYLIDETTTAAETVSTLMLGTVTAGSDALEITLKAVEPTVSKTVAKINGVTVAIPNADGELQQVEAGVEGASARIGDTVTFKLTLDVPDISAAIAANGFFWYQIKDDGGEGLLVEDETGWEVYHNGELETIDGYYLNLPKSFAELQTILNGEANAHRTICEDLMIYIFGSTMETILGADDWNNQLNDRNAAAKYVIQSGVLTEENYAAFTGGGGGLVFRLTTSSHFHAGDTIEILVEALVTEDIVDENGVATNEATLRFTKNPKEHTPDPGNITEKEDPAKVYTHAIDLTKVAMDADGNAVPGTPLSGAQFQVYADADQNTRLAFKVDENGAYVFHHTETKGANGAYTAVYPEKYTDAQKAEETTIVLEVTEAGKLLMKGLDTKTYWLSETAAPDGYMVPEDMLSFQVTATYGATQGNLSTLGMNAGAADSVSGAKIVVNGQGNLETNTVAGYVTNKLGSLLPSTGGNGAMLMTVIGGFGAVVMFGMLAIELTKKKRA